MTSRIAVWVGVLALGTGLAGCDPNENARVQVVYEQVANFQSYVLSPDSTDSHASDGIFILYKLDRIENTGSQAAPFVFDPDDVVAVTDDATTNEGTDDDAELLGGQLATGTTVDPGQTKSSGIGCFIKVAVTNDLTDLTHFSSLVDLVHTITPDQPVTMTRDPSDTDTGLIDGDAVPSAPNVGLQQLCGS